MSQFVYALTMSLASPTCNEDDDDDDEAEMS
jgi:hypothetical protein